MVGTFLILADLTFAVMAGGCGYVAIGSLVYPGSSDISPGEFLAIPFGCGTLLSGGMFLLSMAATYVHFFR